MAKHIIKKRKRKIKLMGMLQLTMVLTIFLSFYTNIFVRTDNNGLMVEIQDTQRTMSLVTVENEALKVSVEKLRNFANVVNIAKDAGLDNLENKITVRRGE